MTALPLPILVVAVAFALMPKLARADIFFAVTVSPPFQYSAAARRIRLSYWLEIAIQLIIAMAVAAFWSRTVGFILMLLAGLWSIARAHGRALAFATTPNSRRVASLSPDRGSLASGIVLWAPTCFVAASGLYAWLYWEALPARLTIHWSSGQANGWMDRTPTTVGFLLGISLLICLLHAISAHGILRRTRRIAVEGSGAASESLFRRLTAATLLVFPYLVVIPVITLAFTSRLSAPSLWPTFIVALVALGITAQLHLGQGGNRLARAVLDEQPVGDRTPDAAWKWGLFYYNPDDVTLFVEKRFGIGYTVNWANRWSWTLMVLASLPIVLLVIFA